MRISYGPDSNTITDSQGRAVFLSDAEIAELTQSLRRGTCPGDPTHYAHSHPGGAWYGVPLDHDTAPKATQGDRQP